MFQHICSNLFFNVLSSCFPIRLWPSKSMAVSLSWGSPGSGPQVVCRAYQSRRPVSVLHWCSAQMPRGSRGPPLGRQRWDVTGDVPKIRWKNVGKHGGNSPEFRQEKMNYDHLMMEILMNLMGELQLLYRCDPINFCVFIVFSDNPMDEHRQYVLG